MIPISRPARFRRSRVLIVGCGDVGVRSLSGLRHAVVRVLSSSAGRLPGLRAQGVTPLLGNLDEPATLARLSGLATRVLHLAPLWTAFLEQNPKIELDISQTGSLQGGGLRIEVIDSGPGFDWSRQQQALLGREVGVYHGRGLQLVDRLCDSLEICGRGNQIIAQLRWGQAPSAE